MSKNRISTEGCTVKWKQRSYKTADENASDVIDNVIAQMSGEGQPHPKKRGVVNVFSNRPDTDGIIHRTSKRRKKNHPNSSKQSRKPNSDLPSTSTLDDLLPEPDSDNLVALEQLISELVSSGDYEVSEWENRQQTLDVDWSSCRSNIMHSIVRASCIPEEELEQHCYACKQEPATLRCIDCNWALLCSKCDETIHSVNPCHDRQSWINEYYESLPQDFYYTFNNYTKFECQQCNNQEYEMKTLPGSFIVVTLKGRFDIPYKLTPTCTICGKWSPTQMRDGILRAGLWPGHPNPAKTSFLFEQRVLKMWYHMSTNFPGASLHGFLGALGQISELNKRKKTISHTAFSRAYREFTYMEGEKELIKGQDNMICPSCSSEQLMCHIDGIHKLYRYKSASKSKGFSYHKDRFIASDSDVKEHLRRVYTAHPTKSSLFQDIYCGSSRWKAARQSTSKVDTLDETGLVVAGCRHAMAQRAVNMHAGELYAYSHYLHVNFLLKHRVQFIWQDVVCKYWPWAKKVAAADPVWKDSVTSLKPALSVMHAKAHSWHCQVCWGGRYRDGAGAGSGEDMEQFFSYFSRIGNTTKHMSSGRRNDTVTDHVLYWNGKKIRGLPEILCRRYQRVQRSMADTQAKLNEISYDRKLLAKWKREVLIAADDAANTSVRPEKPSAKAKQVKQYFIIAQQVKEAESLEKYVTDGSQGISSLLGSDEIFQMAKRRLLSKHALLAQLKELEDNLKDNRGNLLSWGKAEACKAICTSLQHDVELSTTARHQKLQAVANLADTSKRRTRLRMAAVKDKTRVEVMLQKLHQVQLVMDETSEKYDADKILKGHIPWKSQGASFSDKRKVADLLVLRDRLKEELPYLQKEMQTFIRYYQGIQQKLKSAIKELKTRILQIEKSNAPIAEDADAEIQEESQMSSLNELSAAEPESTSDAGMDMEKQEGSQHYVLDESTTEPTLIRGLIGLKQQGLAEVTYQIAWALTCFRKITAADGWRVMELEEEEDFEEEDEDSQENFVLDPDNEV